MISTPRCEVTSTQLTGGQWVGPAVRLQNGGQRRLPGHLLLEFRQPGADAVQEDRGAAGRSSAARYSSGPLAAGTQLAAAPAVRRSDGSALALVRNGDCQRTRGSRTSDVIRSR